LLAFSPRTSRASRETSRYHHSKEQFSSLRPQTVAISFSKGGVGKTTTTINLATELATNGHRVLIVDLDPQGNASTGLGIERSQRKLSSYDVLAGTSGIQEASVCSCIAGLHIIPSTQELNGAELDLADVDRRAYRLRDALERSVDDYQYVLIDCPSSFGLLTLNALTAAHSVLMPVQCEFFALEGLSQLLRSIERVKVTFNPTLDIRGILLTMFDKSNNLSWEVANDVREYLGDKVYETVIPRDVCVAEAPSHGKPVLLYAPQCAASRAYFQFAEEFMERESQLMGTN